MYHNGPWQEASNRKFVLVQAPDRDPVLPYYQPPPSRKAYQIATGKRDLWDWLQIAGGLYLLILFTVSFILNVISRQK